MPRSAVHRSMLVAGSVLLLSSILPMAAAAANNAAVLEGTSSVPGSAGANATVTVRIRVQNTGDTLWRASQAYRLGASSLNQLGWSGYPCGGYMNNVIDGRVFLCHDVAPGQTHDFQFNVRMPASGSARLSVRMVQDGVQWFGETQTWTLSVSGGQSLPDVVVDSIRPDPASPSPGQAVRFISVVRNAGNAPTPSGTVIGVGYFIDGRYVSYGVSGNRLAAGASVTITTQGGLWTATAGNHTLRALVDDVNRFPESNEANNARSMSFTVGSGGCSTSPITTPNDRWKLEIFNNRSLSGSPVEIRTDAAGSGGFTFNWGSGRASNCTGNDNFGIRFSRRFYVGSSGTYKFTTTTDDGVRLWVDGQLIINRWIDQAPTSYSANKSLSAGWHDVRMDYYENGGGAYAAVRWEKTGTGGGEGNLFGINIDPANPRGNPSPQDLKNIGVRWVRIEYKVNPGYSFYDSRIAQYRNAGLKVLLIVDYSAVPGKPNGSTGTSSQWTSYLSSFNNGVRDLASHYGNGVDAWQVWNEPDLPPQPGYDVYIPANYYGILLRDAAATLRQYSSRPVITAGLASGNPNYLARARDAAGGLTVDAVAVHPYGQRAPDNWPNSSWGFGNMSDLFDSYLAFGKPLWVSEIGVNTTDEGFQADYLENVYQLASGAYRDRVQVVFWFCWSDGMVPPFGLLRQNADPNNSADQKPAYHQYRSVAPPY